MKEIKKEKIEYVTVYQAIDGTEFSSKEECLKYDNTAKAALFSRYNKTIVLESTEYEMFKMGSDETSINLVKVSNDKDVDTIIQLCVMYYSLSENNKELLLKKREVLENAIKDEDLVIIYRGYDYDSFSIIDTLNGYIAELRRKANEKKQ